MVEYSILAALSLLSVILLTASWKFFKRRKWLLSWLTLGTGSVVSLITLVLIFFLNEHDTFKRLTQEHAVASIKFNSLGEKHYEVILSEPELQPVYLQLYGDQWQLDARIIKWSGLAAWAGLPPFYRLERISGRYENLQQERTAIRSVFAVNNTNDKSLWDFMIEYQEFIPWFDAYYGSATFMPMVNRAEFRININSNGLIARPDNQEASQSLKRWLAPT